MKTLFKGVSEYLCEAKEYPLAIFKMKRRGFFDEYAIGRYDKDLDVFYVWFTPGYVNDQYGVFGQTETIFGEKIKILLPTNFRRTIGPRLIDSYAYLDDVLSFLKDTDGFKCREEVACPKASLSMTYLVVSNDWKVFLSEVGSFVCGDSFSVIEPEVVNGSSYNMKSALNFENVRMFARIEV